MKVLLMLLGVILFMNSTEIKAYCSQYLLVADDWVQSSTPKNFRSSAILPQKRNALFVSTGLQHLNASASAQFSEMSLPNILPNHVGEVIVVDLRQESHAFIEGYPVSWYGTGNLSNHKMPLAQIQALEEELLDCLRTQQNIEVYRLKKLGFGQVSADAKQSFLARNLETEANLLNRYGVRYVRIPVLDKHRPEDHIVDRFLATLRELPKDTWLHFHCRAGRGRSTTFMAMYDIVNNAKYLPIDVILNRQAIIGGVKLTEYPSERKKLWKRKAAIARHLFLKKFYKYVVDPKGYPTISWQLWVQAKKLQKVPKT